MRIWYLFLGHQSLESERGTGNTTVAERSVVDPSQGLGHALTLPIAIRKIPRTRWQVVQLSLVSLRQSWYSVQSPCLLTHLAFTHVSLHHLHIFCYLTGLSTHHWPILSLSFKNKIKSFIMWWIISYLKRLNLSSK